MSLLRDVHDFVNIRIFIGGRQVHVFQLIDVTILKCCFPNWKGGEV